jgi:2-keto-3-deoxy-L-rhamnonate aldolase RhmA
MKNRLRRALIENRPTFGAWIGIAQPVSAEIFGRLGFDWATVDLEHGVIGLESLANIFGALEGFGCVPVARLPWCDPVWIKRSLDAGARAVIVPTVNSAEQARLAAKRQVIRPRGPGFGKRTMNTPFGKRSC